MEDTVDDELAFIKGKLYITNPPDGKDSETDVYTQSECPGTVRHYLPKDFIEENFVVIDSAQAEILYGK